jgi:hypothetical protein
MLQPVAKKKRILNCAAISMRSISPTDDLLKMDLASSIYDDSRVMTQTRDLALLGDTKSGKRRCPLVYFILFSMHDH